MSIQTRKSFQDWSDMSDVPLIEQVQSALKAGLRPEAARVARDGAAGLGTAEMLELAGVLSDHAMYHTLVEGWRRRQGDGVLDPREHEPYATALNALALEHQQEQRTDDALKLIDRAIQLAPKLRYLRRNLASCLLSKGEFVGALAELDTLLSDDHGDIESLLLLGITRYHAGDPELAAEPLQQSFDAGLAEAGLWLVKSLVLAGRVEEARAVLQRLELKHPDRATAMLELERAEPGSPIHRLDT
jgi:tetratricopeptide (TPR) repeat protein